jgi:hypothetical protein
MPACPTGLSIRANGLSRSRPDARSHSIIRRSESIIRYSAADAAYFHAWIDRVTDATAAYPDWNSAAENRSVLDRLRRANTAFMALE